MKKLLKKSLLAVWLLMGGVNSVWADEVVFTPVASYDFEGETPTNPFTDNSGISGRCNAATYTDATTSSVALKFTGNNLWGKTYGYHVYDFSALTSSSSSVKVAFDFKIANQNHTSFTIRDASLASESNKSSYEGTGAIFKFANARISGSNRLGYNNNTVSGASYDTWYHIEVIVDLVNKKVSYTLKSLDQKTTIDTQSNLSFLTSTATTCTQLDFFGLSSAEMASIDNIIISEYTSSSATTYSVEKYDTSGNLLSSTSNLAGVAGEVSSATDSEKSTFYSNDGNHKYVFDSTDERNVTSMTLTSTVATNVLKLYFNDYAKLTATISPSCGENEVDDITGTFYADETKTLYYPKAIKCDDGYYVVDKNADTPYYGYSFSSSDLSKTITYSLDKTIVYYTEYEDVCGGTTYSANYFTAQSSKGFSKALNNNNVMTTNMNLAAAGVYDILIAGGNRDSGHTFTMYMKIKASDGTISDNNVLSEYFTALEWNDSITKSNVSIPAGSELYIADDNGAGVARFAGDYIIVRKSAVTYTVKYKCGGVEIKSADASRTAVWGTHASLTSADKQDITYNGHLYRYESDDAASQEIVSDGTTIITATFRDLGAVATITYTLNVGSEAGTTIKASATSTDATNITGIDIDQTNATGDGNGANDRTTKLPIKTGANGETYDSPTNYVEFKYTVAAGKQFTLNYATIKVANVGSSSANNMKYKAELSDGTNTISNTYVVTTQDGTVETFYVTNESEVALTGNVTLKLWAWTIAEKDAGGSAFRMGTPLEIIGTTDLLAEIKTAIADCKAYETSAAFATALAAESFSTAAEVYAFHTAWQIAQAKASGSTDLTKLIRNAAVADGTDWGGSSINHGEQYTGAPDEYYLDKWNGTINTNQTIYGVPAGTYKIKAATRSAANTSGTLYVNDGISDIAKVNQITSVGNTGGDLGNGWSWSEMTFTLTETKNLQVGFWADASSSKWAGCDDWHMELLGVSVTVGKNGYTTFASPYALDLTDENRPEGLKAYKATLSGSKLSFQQLHQTVSAGKGLLLLGETNDGTYNIPIVESGDAVETDLTGVLTPTAKQSVENGDYYFVMRKAKTAEEALTFAPITTEHEVTIPEGKVYITVPSSAFNSNSGARAIAVSFDDDETTGIDNLTPALSKGERVVYNLNGQRIDKPAKGLYIVSGKKVFVK